MLKRELKRSTRHNEDGAMPELLGKDLERNLDAVDTKMEDSDELEQDAQAEDPEIEDTGVETEEVPDSLETDLEEPEESFKDINEKVVVYLFRGFSELGDTVRLFVEDEDNEERDPELVETLKNFMDGLPEVMDEIKSLANKYVTSVELFDTEDEEEVSAEDADDVEDEEEPDSEDELDIEEEGIVESYIKEHNLEHAVFESEYEIYAPYTSEEEATKLESELRSFKGAEVFRHEDIGEIHAFVRVR